VALHTRADDLPQLLRQEQPDLILLDLRLGGRVRGWELLSEFDLDPILHHVPVIICSAARNELRDRTTWLAERGIESLEKPFDIDDLYRAVDAALGAGASELC
jgi:CheY-like chemotaxis protein